MRVSERKGNNMKSTLPFFIFEQKKKKKNKNECADEEGVRPKQPCKKGVRPKPPCKKEL